MGKDSEVVKIVLLLWGSKANNREGVHILNFAWALTYYSHGDGIWQSLQRL